VKYTKSNRQTVLVVARVPLLGVAALSFAARECIP
jgi:hypothetical protein